MSREKAGRRQTKGREGWRPQLTRDEKRLGWVFFALYLFLFPFLVGGAVRILDEKLNMALTAAQSSAVYYLIILGVLVAAFWEFLKNALRILKDNLRENIYAVVVAVAAGLIVTCAVSLLPLPVENPVYRDYPEQFAMSPVCTFLVVVLLRPWVEEIMFRGLLFGSLRKVNRPLAYAVSAGLFALATVWQYVLPDGGAACLLLAIRYLPMGLALTWSYDIGGSVFAPILTRVCLSAAFLALAVK